MGESVHLIALVGSGGRPCVKCSQASQVCRYPPSVARIVVDETLVERLQARCEALENCLFEVIPERQLRDDIAGRYGLILRPGINIGPERSGEGQPHWGSHSSNSGEGDEEDYLQVFLPGPVGYISKCLIRVMRASMT